MTTDQFVQPLFYFPIFAVFTILERVGMDFHFPVSRSRAIFSCRKSHVDNFFCERHTLVVAGSHFAMTSSYFAATQIQAAADDAAPAANGRTTVPTVPRKRGA
jgi:hypothetical protein